jgi:8-hydroxy-5-deazaflavin:NADPH oxidoreductase
MPEEAKTALPTIAILGGTGKEGPGLAIRWAYAGYPVLIGSRQADKAQAVAAGLNAALGFDAVRGLENGEAARRADICVLTIVQAAHQAALESLRDDLAGKIVVDATARVDFRNPLPPAPPSAGRIAQDILGPAARVVAAFQNVPAHALKKDPQQPLDAHVLVCADDQEAAAQVIELAQGAGLQAYYAGGLDNAIVVEGLTSILISLNKHYGVKTASISISGLQAA